MEGGGKIKTTRGHSSSKPYARTTSLLGRVADMLSPSWLVELVSSSVKKKPSEVTGEQPQQHTQHRQQCLESNTESRPVPDMSNSYVTQPGAHQGSMFNNHMQHSTPMPGHGQQQPLHFHNSSISLAGLNKLDLHSNLLANGGDDHTELPNFSAPSSQYNTGTSSGLQQHMPNVSNSVGPSAFYNSTLDAASSKIQQLRQDLGGSLTPSKEIEERAKLNSYPAKKSSNAEPSFLWANEAQREVKKNTQQPPAKRHKPDFNESVFGAHSFTANKTMQSSFGGVNSSFHSSSFYPGKTMFGGAAANRTRAPNSPYQVTPARKQVFAKSLVPSKVGVTSSSAKRILDCLEKMSTPLTDAKKIPSYNSSSVDSPLSFTPGVYRRRSVKHQKKNLPPVGNLSTPVAVRVSQNLHKAAVKPETAPVVSKSRPVEETQRRSETGKIGRERKRDHYSAKQQESDEEVEVPDLATEFQLPVSGNLPKFDFGAASAKVDTDKRPAFVTSSPICTDSGKRTNAESMPFTFSSPIAETNKSVDVSEKHNENAFTFSSPISVDKERLAVAPGVVSAAPSLAFAYSPSSQLKKRTSAPPEVEKPLVTGSVMDFFSKTASPSTTKVAADSATGKPSLGDVFAQKATGWSCPTCMVQNKDTMDKCPCCSEPKPASSKPSPAVANKLSGSLASTQSNTASTTQPSRSTLFKKPASGWECPTCMVSNSDTMAKCPLCQTAKPGKAVDTSSTAQSSSIVANTSPTKDQKPLFSLFQSTSGWKCPTCMVQNKAEQPKCPCCETAKPGSSNSDSHSNSVSAKPSLADQFKKPTGSWDCDTCMVTNKSEAVKCIACETPKPGLKPQSSFTSPGGFSGFKFGVQSAANSTTAGVSSISTSASSGFNFGSKALSSSSSAGSSSGFVFGSPSVAGKSEAKTEATPSSGFKFGSTAATDLNKTETKSKEAYDSKPALGGFSFGAPVPADKAPATGGFKFGVESGSGAKTTSALVNHTESGLTSGTAKADSTTTEKNSSINFNAKTDPKDTENKPPVFGFGANASSVSSTQNTSTFSFGTPASNTTASTDSMSAAPSIFGNTTSSLSKVETSSSGNSIASNTFIFGATTNTNAPSANIFGSSTSTTKPALPVSTGGFGGFGEIKTTTVSSSTGTGIFSLSSSASSVSKPSETTTASIAPVFGGFGSSTTTSKTENSNPSVASNPFIFGAAAKETCAKPLGVQSGFNFGTSAANVSSSKDAPAASLFTFGANKATSNDTNALGASPNLKRTRESENKDSGSAKKSTFGSGSDFGQATAQSSGFGNSTPVFGSGTTSGTGSGGTFGTFWGASATQNASKPDVPAFGTGAAVSFTRGIFGGSANNMLGATNASLGGTGGFNFAASQPKDQAAGMFQFSATQNQNGNNSVPTNPFGAQPAATSTPAFGTSPAPGGFNFSATPNINFAASTTSTGNSFQFGAPSGDSGNKFSVQSTGTGARRPIKKAIRRTAKK